MIFFCEGLDYPFEVQAGDALFIAGCRVPVDRSNKLPFEHIALAAESRLIRQSSDFLTLPIYGMPESDPDATHALGPGIVIGTGQAWLGYRRLGVEIGSTRTVWNLAGRVPGVDPNTADYLSRQLAQLAGSFPCRYQSVFRVDPTLTNRLETNCLGFVCSIYERFHMGVVSDVFPTYPTQYLQPNSADRDFPSPGHVAHALNMHPPAFPYCARDSEEAERYARADVTLQEFLEECAGVGTI